jgi:hypothetical protein
MAALKIKLNCAPISSRPAATGAFDAGTRFTYFYILTSYEDIMSLLAATITVLADQALSTIGAKICGGSDRRNCCRDRRNWFGLNF